MAAVPNLNFAKSGMFDPSHPLMPNIYLYTKFKTNIFTSDQNTAEKRHSR